jgi:hypothetical protein
MAVLDVYSTGKRFLIRGGYASTRAPWFSSTSWENGDASFHARCIAMTPIVARDSLAAGRASSPSRKSAS